MTTATDSAALPLTLLAPLRCTKYGTEGVGSYCTHCGKRLHAHRDLSVKHFLKDGVSAVAGTGYHRVAAVLVARHLGGGPPPSTATQRRIRGSARTVLAAKYNAEAEGVAKVMVVVLIPLVALGFLVMNAGVGRYVAEHLFLATFYLVN